MDEQVLKVNDIEENYGIEIYTYCSFRILTNNDTKKMTVLSVISMYVTIDINSTRKVTRVISFDERSLTNQKLELIALRECFLSISNSSDRPYLKKLTIYTCSQYAMDIIKEIFTSINESYVYVIQDNKPNSTIIRRINDICNELCSKDIKLQVLIADKGSQELAECRKLCRTRLNQMVADISKK